MKVQQMKQFGLFLFLFFLAVANMATAAKDSIRAERILAPPEGKGKDKGDGGGNVECGQNTDDASRPKGKPINKNDSTQPADGNEYCKIYDEANCPARLDSSHTTEFNHVYSDKNDYCGCKWENSACVITCVCDP